MTDLQPIDPSELLSDQLAAASPDLLRNMLSTFIQTLMSAEADTICGAGYGEHSNDRVNHRNGYRHRDFDARVGTIDVAIPKLRSGSRRCCATTAATRPPRPSRLPQQPEHGTSAQPFGT